MEVVHVFRAARLQVLQHLRERHFPGDQCLIDGVDLVGEAQILIHHHRIGFLRVRQRCRGDQRFGELVEHEGGLLDQLEVHGPVDDDLILQQRGLKGVFIFVEQRLLLRVQFVVEGLYVGLVGLRRLGQQRFVERVQQNGALGGAAILLAAGADALQQGIHHLVQRLALQIGIAGEHIAFDGADGAFISLLGLRQKFPFQKDAAIFSFIEADLLHHQFFQQRRALPGEERFLIFLGGAALRAAGRGQALLDERRGNGLAVYPGDGVVAAFCQRRGDEQNAAEQIGDKAIFHTIFL